MWIPGQRKAKCRPLFVGNAEIEPIQAPQAGKCRLRRTENARSGGFGGVERRKIMGESSGAGVSGEDHGFRCMIALIFLAGCAGRDNSPRWRANAAAEMESYDRYALEGHPALAAAAYRKAAEALKLGADVQGLARAALRRCAVESVTGDKKQDCKDYAALRDVSGGGDLDAYARWMTHSILPGDAELLPEPQREIARAWLLRDENGIIRALERIESSLSFLVAFSVVHAQVVEPLSLLDRCRDLTAREGWVAAHRECLRREQRWHEKRGASREAERVERLIKALQP